MGTYTISLKGDTTGNWEASDRVLVKNEVGVERDDNDNVVGIKIGNGVEGWNGLDYAYGQYSKTPQRIGAWIDGKPIYRMAFDVLLKDMDAVDYGDLLSSQLFYVCTSTGSGVTYPISTFCAYTDTNGTARLLYPCGIDAFNEFFVAFAVPDGVTIPEDQSDCTDERYYGYIDFIQTGDNV